MNINEYIKKNNLDLDSVEDDEWDKLEYFLLDLVPTNIVEGSVDVSAIVQYVRENFAPIKTKP